MIKSPPQSKATFRSHASPQDYNYALHRDGPTDVIGLLGSAAFLPKPHKLVASLRESYERNNESHLSVRISFDSSARTVIEGSSGH